MTREEAKEILEKIKLQYDTSYEEDALEMAIKALSQQRTGQWEWVQYDGNPKIGNYHCTNCHSIGKAFYDYCPMCGTKMQ